MEAGFEKAREIEKKASEKLRETDQRIGIFIIDTLFQPLLDEYKSSSGVTKYLTDLRPYTLQNLEFFKQQEGKVDQSQAFALVGVPPPQAAGEMQADGSYPDGSVSYLVNKKLKDMAEGLKSFTQGGAEQ